MNIIWTPEIILVAIKTRKDSNQPLAARRVLEQDSKLYGAAFRHFGGWIPAVKAAGLPYDKNGVARKRAAPLLRSNGKNIRTEEILLIIQRMHFMGEPLNARWVPKMPIYRRACEEYGSWPEALAAANLKYEELPSLTKVKLRMKEARIARSKKPLDTRPVPKKSTVWLRQPAFLRSIEAPLGSSELTLGDLLGSDDAGFSAFESRDLFQKLLANPELPKTVALLVERLSRGQDLEDDEYVQLGEEIRKYPELIALITAE